MVNISLTKQEAQVVLRLLQGDRHQKYDVDGTYSSIYKKIAKELRYY